MPAGTKTATAPTTIEMEPIQILLVTAPGCHFCDEAQRLLADLGNTFPLAIRAIPLVSETGRDLVVRHRVPFPPILIVNGSFFGYGRISRQRLEGTLVGLRAGQAVS